MRGMGGIFKRGPIWWIRYGPDEERVIFEQIAADYVEERAPLMV